MKISIALVLVLFVRNLAFGATQSTPYVWTGVTKSADGASIGKVPPSPDPKSLRETAVGYLKELAGIQLLVDVDRKLDEASKQTFDLWIRAAWEKDYADRMEVLVQVARTRADVLAKLGRREEALEATKHLLLDEAAKKAAPAYELVPADAKTVAAESKALADPRLVALRDKLAGRVSPVEAAAQGDAIEQAVNDALNIQHAPGLVLDIGPRAAPALEKMILADLDTLSPQVEGDPLRLLLASSEMRGAQLILDRFDGGGFFWHKRILRAMSDVDVLENPGTWQVISNPGTPPKLLEPIWLDVLDRLLADPLVGREAVRMVKLVAEYDALSTKLQLGLTRAIASQDADLAKEVLDLLASAVSRKTVKPVFERALQHTDPAVRRFAAEHILDYDSSDALLACVDHADPVVRATLARALRPRSILYAVWGATRAGGTQYRSFEPPIGEAERAALVRLYGDADAGVHGEAARSVLALKEPLDAATYLKLAKDPAVDVRGELAKWTKAPPAFRLRLFEVLAQDSDPAVLRELDSTLSKLDLDEGEADSALAVVRARFANRALPLDFSRDGRGVRVLRMALQSPKSVRETTRWVLETKDVALLRILVQMICPEAVNTTFANSVTALDGPGLVSLYRATFERANDFFDRLDQYLAERGIRGEIPVGELVVVVADETAPCPLRIRAAAIAAISGGDAFGKALSALLASGCPAQFDMSGGEVHVLGRIGQRLPQADVARILALLVSSRKEVDAFSARIAEGALRSSNSLLEPALSRKLLDRWLPERDQYPELVECTFWRIPPGLDAATTKDLIEAARTERFVSAAIATMERLRAPMFVDALGACLGAEWISNSDDRQRVQVQAAKALTGYMDDAAAQHLLQALGSSPNEKVRKACLDGLESIRKYQDEAGRWAARRTGKQARDEAVAQLLPMLEDADATIRAQAARSLATLEAVEHLPKLVKMLKDKAPEVRDAAKQALDALNTAGAKKP